jgi:hypothetical protein
MDGIKLNDKVVQHIAGQLREYGIVRVERYTKVSAVARDARTALENAPPLPPYEFGKACRIYNDHIKKHKHIREFFNTPWMRKVASAYLGRVKSFNSEIFITHDYQTDKGLAPNGHLHFDRARALKFFLYLNDVGPKNGPLMFVPKTHKLGAELRKKAVASAKHYMDIKNHIEDYPDVKHDKPVSVTGKAGTLVVFDSDIFHMGGITSPGKERWVIRAHSR